ncbi:hypothetical protein SAMN05519103_06030 [Rhizobiales bacterium GAS113]|nr:hypothetical protein SAMN05519103_06030 [Rhizobiales bacterium GAS113]
MSKPPTHDARLRCHETPAGRAGARRRRIIVLVDCAACDVLRRHATHDVAPWDSRCALFAGNRYKARSRGSKSPRPSVPMRACRHPSDDLSDLSKAAGRLVAAKSIQTCSTCAAKNKEAGAESAILRSWLQAPRVTCPICGERLSTVGEGGFPGADFGSPFGHLWNDALRGERLVDDAAERGIWTWAQPIDIVRFLLIRRDPKPICRRTPWRGLPHFPC